MAITAVTLKDQMTAMCEQIRKTVSACGRLRQRVSGGGGRKGREPEVQTGGTYIDRSQWPGRRKEEINYWFADSDRAKCHACHILRHCGNREVMGREEHAASLGGSFEHTVYVWNFFNIDNESETQGLTHTYARTYTEKHRYARIRENAHTHTHARRQFLLLLNAL